LTSTFVVYYTWNTLHYAASKLTIQEFNCMKTFRNLALVFTLLALCIVVPLSAAQDGSTFGLSQEDFTVWSNANANSASATSAQFSFTLTGSATGGDAPVSWNITGTGLYGTENESPLFQLTLGGSATNGGETTPIDLEIRMIGTTIYFNGPGITGGDWWFLSSEEATGMAGMMSGGMPMNPASIMGSLGDREEMSEGMQMLSDMRAGSYVSIVRNGNQFTITPDIAGFVGSEGFQQLMLTAAESNADSMDMTPEEMQQAASMMGSAIDPTVTIDQYVSDDNKISRTVFDLAWNVDPSEFGQEGSVSDVTLNFDISLSGYNGTYTIPVPEGAVSFVELMQQMMQPSTSN